MRHALLFGLILLIPAVTKGDEKPIPQDAAKIEKRRLDLLEWNRRTLGGAYEKVGKHDPRWDDQARKALDLAARMFSLSVDPPITSKDVFPAAKAAVDAGCDDPMVNYIYNRTIHGKDYPGLGPYHVRCKKTAKELAASEYPAFRRSIPLRMSGADLIYLDGKVPSDEDAKEAERLFDESLALIEESVRSDERNAFWEDRWLENLVQLIRCYRKLGLDPVAAYNRVDAPLAKLPEAKVLRLLVRGQFWMDYGWEARGTGFAAAVPAGGFEALEERLEVARKAYTEAWEARPGTGKAATQLMTIDKSIGGDREAMELWFERAMNADGDDRDACWQKLDWLDPKWHGTAEEMVAFGRACRDTRNWRAKITPLVADAHRRFASHMSPQDRRAYLSAPEVWSDIGPIFEEYLGHYPDDDAVRSKYASMSYMAGHYPESHAQFEALGDRLTTWTDFPNVPLDSLKKQREIVARAVAGKGGPAAPPPGWVRLRARNNEGAWSVALPARAERQTAPGILGAGARNTWTCVAEGLTYRVRVQPLAPAAAGAEGRGDALEDVRAAIAEEQGGKALAPSDVALAGHPAQEFLVGLAIKPGPRVVRIRLARIGGRLYELSVSGPEPEAMGAAASAFLDSFRYE